MELNLGTLIDEKVIRFEFPGNDKNEIIKDIAALMYEAGKVSDKDKYTEGVFEREKECTTGIGKGVAIPHCKSAAVKEASFALIKLKNSVEWNSLDGQPVDYVIMLAAPDNGEDEHLKMLSQLARNLMDDDFVETLTHAATVEEIKKLFMGGR